ncbi:MAG: hypothetical protein QOJ71_83 [Actinomycetota bacterium]|nr:hypothetical protein [Actinomycetota bacterium]
MKRETHALPEEILARVEALIGGNETQHSTEHGALIWEHERLDLTVRDLGCRGAAPSARWEHAE